MPDTDLTSLEEPQTWLFDDGPLSEGFPQGMNCSQGEKRYSLLSPFA